MLWDSSWWILARLQQCSLRATCTSVGRMGESNPRGLFFLTVRTGQEDKSSPCPLWDSGVHGLMCGSRCHHASVERIGGGCARRQGKANLQVHDVHRLPSWHSTRSPAMAHESDHYAIQAGEGVQGRALVTRTLTRPFML